MRQRRTSQGLRAESGEVMRSQERNDGSSLRRSGPTQGSSTNGGKRRWLRCRPRHVLALLVPRAGPESDDATGWLDLAFGFLADFAYLQSVQTGSRANRTSFHRY